MNQIILPLNWIGNAKKADKKILPSEWIEDESYLKFYLPQLSEPKFFKKNGFIADIKNNRYCIEFDDDSDDDGWDELETKKLIFTPTNEDLTKENDKKSGYFQLFGQPVWRQGEYYPLDLLGNPCYHLLTINNGWGDLGVYNILIGFDSNHIPNIAYFESSCS